MASIKLLVFCVVAVVCLELQQGQAQGDGCLVLLNMSLFVQCKDIHV